MLKRLSPKQIAHIIQSYLKKPSDVSQEAIDEVLELFPFAQPEEGLENPNFYAVKLLRTLKEKVDTGLLAEKLSVDRKLARQFLTSRSFEVYFPVAKEREAALIKALIIPLEGKEPIALEDIPRESLSTLRKLTGKSFFLTFSHGFDFKTASFMLAVYSALVLGSVAERFAFTGVLSEEGAIERVKFLDKKLEEAKKRGVPLIFPSGCMANTQDLRTFFEELTIPLGALPGANGSTFEKKFRFSEEYIRSVFHIDYPLIWTQSFNDSSEDFERFALWLERVSEKLKDIRENYLPVRVGATSKLLCMSFLMGVRLSKARLPVDFYKYNQGEYIRLLSVESDDYKPTAKRFIQISEPKGDIKEVRISLKAQFEDGDERLTIKVPSGDELDRNVLEIAIEVASELRSREMESPRLVLETSTALSFALGYYLEDYKSFVLTHRVGDGYRDVYILRKGSADEPYLLNAFSINMLAGSKAIVEFRRIDLEEAKDLLKRGFRSYISHPSTAKVLSELLGIEIRHTRENIKLKGGDWALVFQLGVRPREGEVFGEEELKEIVESGRFSFYLVKVS